VHAQQIILDLLDRHCPEIHAKRRQCLAALAQAGQADALTLVGMGRNLPATTNIRHRIKRCDRLLGNRKLSAELLSIYAAVARRFIAPNSQPIVIIDWSDLLRDQSAHMLRAAVMVQGRAMLLYEEVHVTKDYGTAKAHRQFLKNLISVLPPGCQPVIVTDAGFRATWFNLINKMGWAWIGRIRNRDMVRSSSGDQPWQGCKALYSKANKHAKDLGNFEYARSNPVACRLVLVKRVPKGRHKKTASGKRARSRNSLKSAASQTEPWLLAVSPSLSNLTAEKVVAQYGGRMQIEQTFRDLKNPRWGLALSHTQTRCPKRLAILLVIGALVIFALWLIGLSARAADYRIEYGSKKNAPHTLSIISLARSWLRECGQTCRLTRHQLDIAIAELRSQVRNL
jgi:hypothetical protein